MLYETLLQWEIFLCMLYYGILCGMVFEAKKLIENAFLKNKYICIVLDILFMFISALLFITSMNAFNYGEFRLFLLISFVIGGYTEHIFIGFIVEKFFKMVYNIFTRLLKRLKSYRPKNKFIKKLLK